jgi:hypothetical protein
VACWYLIPLIICKYDITLFDVRLHMDSYLEPQIHVEFTTDYCGDLVPKNYFVTLSETQWEACKDEWEKKLKWYPLNYRYVGEGLVIDYRYPRVCGYYCVRVIISSDYDRFSLHFDD